MLFSWFSDLADELKREPKNGIPGTALRVVDLEIGKGNLRAVALVTRGVDRCPKDVVKVRRAAEKVWMRIGFVPY
jgi:hypothetical protein